MTHQPHEHPNEWAVQFLMDHPTVPATRLSLIRKVYEAARVEGYRMGWDDAQAERDAAEDPDHPLRLYRGDHDR